MQNSIKLKPIFWRLTIFKFVPFYIGWAGAKLIFDTYKHLAIDWQFLSLMAIAGFIIFMIATFFQRNKYEIVLLEGKITGLSVAVWGLNTETFTIDELDKSSFEQRTFYEKISGYYSLKSISGKKIMFSPFLYGNQVAKEFQNMLLGERMS